MSKKVVLQSLEIERARYGENKGKFMAKVKVGNERSSFEMLCSEEFTKKVIQLCGAEIINELNRATHEFTMDLATDIGLEIDFSFLEQGEGHFKLVDGIGGAQ